MKVNFKKVLIAFLSVFTLAACGSNAEGKKYASFDDPNATVSAGGEKVSLKGVSAEERTKILGLLEKYAVENTLTGISLFENGGYAMYNEGVQLGTETYIPGYGFGTLREGNITAELAGETNQAWKKYYHTFETEDPNNLNYMDDKGSVVGGLIGYASGSYFTTKMNDARDGYVWCAELAKADNLEAMNADETGVASKYRFEVKVGSELKYNTLTKDSKLAEFKNREVALEDYLTPYKLLWNKKIAFARAAENITSSTGIAGSADYYAKTENGIDEEAFKNVGVKAYVENGKNYVEIELNQPATPFMARYYISSSMYAPVPMDFIKALDPEGKGDVTRGAKAWGKKTDAGLTPVDTTLSTSTYVLESWETDKQIVFTKNENVNTGDAYKIPGVHIAILKGQLTDSETALREFLANKLHAVGIPMTRLNEFKNDPRTKQTTGDSVFKLNVNACDAETWEKLFGENGSVTTTAKSDYWEVEPALSNDDFVLGLSYSINREEFATKRGSVPSVNYFSSNYLIDPENGISYNSTEAHKEAIASITAKGKIQDGYSITLAQAYFKSAAEKLIADGVYKVGDVIELEIAWQTATNVTNYGEDIAKYFEDAFNGADTGLTLKVNNMAVATWSDVYYKKMMVGQYDLGFGSISGNSYDPLNFMEVLKSDNSSGFTLNWGTDTNVAAIEYNGQKWSYDALWQAADTSVMVKDGVKVGDDAYVAAKLTKSTHNEDGTRTVVINTYLTNDDEIGVYSKVTGVNAVFKGQELELAGAVKFELKETEDGKTQLVVIIPEGCEYAFDSVELTIDFVTYGIYDIDENGELVPGYGNPVQKVVDVQITAK